MMRRPPGCTRTDTLFPTRRSSDLGSKLRQACCSRPGLNRLDIPRGEKEPETFELPGVVLDNKHPPHTLREARFQPFQYLDQFPSLDRLHDIADRPVGKRRVRSEEHTSELQSLMRTSYAVFCLKKKTNKHHTQHIHLITSTHYTTWS